MKICFLDSVGIDLLVSAKPAEYPHVCQRLMNSMNVMFMSKLTSCEAGSLVRKRYPGFLGGE